MITWIYKRKICCWRERVPPLGCFSFSCWSPFGCPCNQSTSLMHPLPLLDTTQLQLQLKRSDRACARTSVRVRLLERSNFQVRGHKERTRSRLGARGSDAQERTIFVANDDEEKKNSRTTSKHEKNHLTRQWAFFLGQSWQILRLTPCYRCGTNLEK